MFENLRRIVTENDENGRSVARIVGPPANIIEIGGHGLGEIWNEDSLPTDVKGAARDTTPGRLELEPKRGGVKFRYVTIPPGKKSLSPEELLEGEAVMAIAFDKIGAAHCQIKGARHPGMHKTETLDFITLISGRITLLLDEADYVLKPGDSVVQRGTAHAWKNTGTEPALLMAVLIDANNT